SLVNSDAELGFSLWSVKNLDLALRCLTDDVRVLYIGILIGRTGRFAPLFLSLRKREDVLYISRAVEITPWA
ncbi:hypothetical protein A2U01_0092494, partial [Trifolium medium]|nr:hypothetical protein [Trifolium medium]